MLDDVKATTGYLTQKEEALDRKVWGNAIGKGYRAVVRQTTE